MLTQLTCVETSQEYRDEQCRNQNRTDDPNSTEGSLGLGLGLNGCYLCYNLP